MCYNNSNIATALLFIFEGLILLPPDPPYKITVVLTLFTLIMLLLCALNVYRYIFLPSNCLKVSGAHVSGQHVKVFIGGSLMPVFDMTLNLDGRTQIPITPRGL